MLTKFGLRKTMLIKAAIDAATLTVGFVLIRERRIVDPNAPPPRIIWYDKKYFTDLTFWSLVACMCLCNFGFPAPFFFLPTYAKQNIPDLSPLVSGCS